MKHVESNYRCRFGEVDLIMQENECLVFVEVRFRASQRYGGALASVGRNKIARLRRTAQHYLQRFDPAEHRPCRFDLVIPDSSDGNGWVWIKNAF
ncbi:YraN family protein [Pseudomonadota bacterium]